MRHPSINTFTIMGKLVTHLDPFTTNNGKRQILAVIETSREFYANGEKKEFTQTVKIGAWGKDGDKLESAAAGDIISATGEIRGYSWNKGGTEDYGVELTAKAIDICMQESAGGQQFAGDPVPF